MVVPKFHTRFTPPQGSVIDQTGQKTKVRQSEKDNCDINKIMERFNRTGQLPNVKSQLPQFGNAIAVDYATALNIIKEAKTAFLKLPSKVRQEFGQDPQNYLQALNDTSPDNVKRLIKLGILETPQEKPDETLRKIAKNTEKVPEQSEKQLAKKGGNSQST